MNRATQTPNQAEAEEAKRQQVLRLAKERQEEVERKRREEREREEREAREREERERKETGEKERKEREERERAADLERKVKEDMERADAIAKIEEDKKLRAPEKHGQADEWLARGKSFADAARAQVLSVPLGPLNRGKSFADAARAQVLVA